MVDAVNYDQLNHARVRPDNNLVFDGWMRSEARNNDYLDGSAVAKNFGADKGDTVSYVIPPEERMAQGVITLRYRLKQNARVTFQLKGISDQKVALVGTGKFELAQIPFSDGANGDSRLILESEGGSGVGFNGFFIGPSGDANRIDITQTERKFAPEVIHGDSNNLILKYRDIDDYYGIAWDFSPSVVREFLNDELDIFFRMKLQNHVDKTFVGNKLGHYGKRFPSTDRAFPRKRTDGLRFDLQRLAGRGAAGAFVVFHHTGRV